MHNINLCRNKIHPVAITTVCIASNADVL